MSIDYIKSSFGYHSFSEVEAEHRGKVAGLNVANAVGYVPVLGLITGVARAIFFWKMMNAHVDQMSDLDRKVCRLQVVRGVVEAMGFGLVYLVADILITLERNEQKTVPPVQVQEVEVPSKEEIVEDPPVLSYDEPLCPDLVEAWQRKYPNYQWR